MNIAKLNTLESTVIRGEIKRSDEFFAGANLIISNDPSRSRYDHDVFVLTVFPEEISWVIFQLKDVFRDEIDYLSKLGFYPSLGRAANRAIAAEENLTRILLAVINDAKDFWSNRPLQD